MSRHARSLCLIVAALASVLLATPPAAWTQTAKALPRIGYLNVIGIPTTFGDAFRKGLRDLGWKEGDNAVLDYRVVDPARVPETAADMVRRGLDIIVVSATAIHGARTATARVPTVFVIADDPVRAGYATSLARPGGRMTGLTSLNVDLDAKRLEILKMALPTVTRIGVLTTPVDPMTPERVIVVEQAARALGLQIQILEVPSAERLPTAFERAVRGKAGAVMVLGSPPLLLYQSRIVDLAAKAHLPVVSAWQEFPNQGGLISYGTNVAAMFERAASFVDRILKGADPATVPVERATTFELVVNVKTARALGLSIPADLLARADRLIE
jgi:putative ABC transport system substrate-binding protein